MKAGCLAGNSINKLEIASGGMPATDPKMRGYIGDVIGIIIKTAGDPVELYFPVEAKAGLSSLKIALGDRERSKPGESKEPRPPRQRNPWPCAGRRRARGG